MDDDDDDDDDDASLYFHTKQEVRVLSTNDDLWEDIIFFFLIQIVFMWGDL